MTRSNHIMCDQPRVLVVEDNVTLRKLYTDLLNYWDYQPYVARGQGEQLLYDAARMAKDQRCHLALVDLRLLDTEDRTDRSGLQLVPQLKPTESIIVTGLTDYRLVRESLTTWGALTFVGKEEDPERLKEELDKASCRYCACRRDLDLQPQELVRSLAEDFYTNDPSVPEDEVADVLARLFPNAKKLSISLIESSGERSLSRVPRPRSRVLLVRQDDLQPEVVKLARARKIDAEIDKYKMYIEGRLVGHFSPPIKTWGVLWDLGGAVYPFMGATNVRSFATYYEEATLDQIKYSLNQFFGRTWSDLYQIERDRPVEGNLFDAYCDVWDPKWYTERVIDFQNACPSDEMPPESQALQAPDPVSWLIDKVRHKSEIPPTALAVTHGDLHGDNILVDENRNVWGIDFERSGPGPILQDFVELETDILNRLVGLPKDDFESLYTLGIWVAKSPDLSLPPEPWSGLDDRLERAMHIITHLRRLAHRCTGETDARPYLWGLLLNALFRATLLTHEKQRRNQQRALMLGSMFCHRLDHWEEPWPPAEWPRAYTEKE